MLPITVAGAVTAARESDARARAAQARYAGIARRQVGARSRPTVPTQPRRRFRWRRWPIIRPA